MAKKPFKLTAQNYYSSLRPHVSTSQIKDYLMDPEFYYRKHVLKDPSLATETTDPMKRGSIVDELLTGSTLSYQRKVLKREDPELFAKQKSVDKKFLVTDLYWNQAMQVAQDLKKHPLWTDYMKESVFQVVLQGTVGGLKVCGLADRLIVFKDTQTVRLIDLKVVNPIKIDNAKKWLTNCVDMHYVHQFAMYQELICQAWRIEKSQIECAHIVGAYVQPGYTKVAGFIMDQSYIDIAFKELQEACRNIAEGNFPAKLATWENAYRIEPFVPKPNYQAKELTAQEYAQEAKF